MSRREKNGENIRAPLFDRLVDKGRLTLEETTGHLRTYDRKEYKESIRIELVRLMNARCSLTVDEYFERELTVIDYGIPDISHFSSRKFDDQKQVELILTNAVSAFEPRLKSARVSVQKAEDNSLQVKVDAMLVIDSIREPVSFPTIRLSLEKHGEVNR